LIFGFGLVFAQDEVVRFLEITELIIVFEESGQVVVGGSGASEEEQFGFQVVVVAARWWWQTSNQLLIFLNGGVACGEFIASSSSWSGTGMRVFDCRNVGESVILVHGLERIGVGFYLLVELVLRVTHLEGLNGIDGREFVLAKCICGILVCYVNMKMFDGYVVLYLELGRSSR
jgi:hypothetical protein